MCKICPSQNVRCQWDEIMFWRSYFDHWWLSLNCSDVFFINLVINHGILHLSSVFRSSSLMFMLLCLKYTGTGSSMGVFHLSSTRPLSWRETCTSAWSYGSDFGTRTSNQLRIRRDFTLCCQGEVFRCLRSTITFKEDCCWYIIHTHHSISTTKKDNE